MTGRVEKRYESSWTIIIELGYDRATKKRKRIVESVEVATESEAKEIMYQRMYEIRHKKYIKRDNMTVGEYLDEWLKFKKTKLAPKTYHSYESEIKRHVKPEIGSIPLQELEAIDLQKYYYTLETEGRIKQEDVKREKVKPKRIRKKKIKENENTKPAGLSQRTVTYHHRILSAALKQAVKWKMIPYNPALNVDPPTFEKKEMSVLHREELDRFLKIIKEHQDFNIIFTAVMSGMRQGEILGARWQDVNFDTGLIEVKQQLQYLPEKGFFFKTPKTPKSKRQIPMQLPLNKMLREIKKEQIKYRSEFLEDYQEYDLVFCRPNGDPWDGGKISNRFKELITDFGRPDMRFHDLRHTFAALALAAGVTMDKLQRIMGHESITTTIDMYGHFSPDTLSEEMKKLSQYLGFGSLTD